MAAPASLAARLDAIMESHTLDAALTAVSALRRDLQAVVEGQRARSQRRREREKAERGTTYTPAMRSYYLEHKATLNAGRTERRRTAGRVAMRSDPRPESPGTGQETPIAPQ